jgi:hypothetical protein
VAFLNGAAAARVANLAREIDQILAPHAAHGRAALIAALVRAVEFGRWRADDVCSTLAAGAAPTPARPRRALVLTLSSVPARHWTTTRSTRARRHAHRHGREPAVRHSPIAMVALARTGL